MLLTVGERSVTGATEGVDESDRPDLENGCQSQLGTFQEWFRNILAQTGWAKCQELWFGSRFTLSAVGI